MLRYRWTDTMEQLARSVSASDLGHLAAKLFIGSACILHLAFPKSIPLAYKLLEVAQEISTSEEEKQTTNYFLGSLKRMEAVETKQTRLFAESGKLLIDLANSGHAIAQFSGGKELLLLARGVHEVKKKAEMQFTGSAWMIASAKQGYWPAFFYVGWLHEFAMVSIRSLDTAYDWYLLAAAYGDPQAYFRLSQL